MIELIVNPVAGNGRAKRALAQIQRELQDQGLDHCIAETEACGHATELARAAIARGSDAVAVLGGDGLLSEVCQALSGTDVRLLFVPCGTGNDFIKSLRLPKDPVAALRLQLSNPSRRIDCGALNGVPFINVAGTGLDTDVLMHTEKKEYKKHMNGLAPYIIGLFNALKGSRPFDAEVTIDGVVERGSYTIISIANGRYFGGGMKIAPLADLTNGSFDVILVRAMPKWRLCMMVPLILPGWHLHLAECRRVIARDVVISRAEPFTVQVDGELSEVQRAHFSVLPSAVSISCP